DLKQDTQVRRNSPLNLIKEGFRDRGSKQWKSKGTRRHYLQTCPTSSTYRSSHFLPLALQGPTGLSALDSHLPPLILSFHSLPLVFESSSSSRLLSTASEESISTTTREDEEERTSSISGSKQPVEISDLIIRDPEPQFRSSFLKEADISLINRAEEPTPGTFLRVSSNVYALLNCRAYLLYPRITIDLPASSNSHSPSADSDTESYLLERGAEALPLTQGAIHHFY
ncbi:hypothetical protein Tco_0576174, partial [Tanacetum coccineum]